jgi:hypothetical protein
MSATSIILARRAPLPRRVPFAPGRPAGGRAPSAPTATDPRYWEARRRAWWRRALLEVLVADLGLTLLGAALLLLLS